jgi:hypothetical protein
VQIKRRFLLANQEHDICSLFIVDELLEVCDESLLPRRWIKIVKAGINAGLREARECRRRMVQLAGFRSFEGSLCAAFINSVSKIYNKVTH